MKKSKFIGIPILVISLCILIVYSCKHEAKDESSSKVISSAVDTLDVYKRLSELGIELPQLSAPIANYVNSVQSGKLLILAGKGPKDAAGNYIQGKLGKDVTVSQAYDAARITGIMQLAAIHEATGDLNKVNRIVKVNGMVNCTDSFDQQPEVINGFSDLMVEVFGERGKHARAAVGMNSLPRNMVCEIEMIVELK